MAAKTSKVGSSKSSGHPSRIGTLTTRQITALKSQMGGPYPKLPAHSAFTYLLRHGGLPVLLDNASTARRLLPYLSSNSGSGPQDPEMTPEQVARQLEVSAQNFFRKLDNRPGYLVNADLVSYISFPYKGQAFEQHPKVSADVPAVFTFVGQFVDHDLTMNGVDLFVNQTGAVPDGASPLVDLDHVYGPRSNDADPQTMIFDSAGRFKLVPVSGTSGFDLPRTPVPTPPGQIPQSPPTLAAHIFDARNDENQLILQIHILLQRVHNKLISTNKLNTAGKPAAKVISTVRKEVVANWQTVILQDYLTRVIHKETLSEVVDQIRQVNFGNLKYKPFLDLASKALILKLPHEWAIGFRFGHSQLRPQYYLNNSGGENVKLFDIYTKNPGVDDLRGGVKLPASHVIEWPVFYPVVQHPHQTPHANRSLRIDGKVTPPVFNLPESTIPDNVKTANNLPQRNLTRGRSIGVVSGEELYDFYSSDTGGPAVTLFMPKLHPADVAPADSHHLFMHDAPNGVPTFKTPLWYYIIKEAEKQGRSKTLGALGSRLVAEVVAGGIYYDSASVYFNPNYATTEDPTLSSGVFPPQAATWTSVITNSKNVTLHDLINFATT